LIFKKSQLHYSLDLFQKDMKKSSTIITTNKPFEEWADVFGDDVVASAILPIFPLIHNDKLQ